MASEHSATQPLIARLRGRVSGLFRPDTVAVAEDLAQLLADIDRLAEVIARQERLAQLRIAAAEAMADAAIATAELAAEGGGRG